MTNAAGTVMASETFTGNNFSGLADNTVQCEGSDAWDDGYFEVMLTAPYDETTGDVTIRITNTLNQ
jgi:hypothetical protein